MEFHVKMLAPLADLDAIERAIAAVDPSALVDVDAAGPTLRVAASIDAVELLALLAQAGYPVARQQVAAVASICCGGCSG